MKTINARTFSVRSCAISVASAVIFGLTACGGGGEQSDSTVASTGSAAGADPVGVTALSDVTVTPAYHQAPVVLDEPADTDADGNAASARMAPYSQSVFSDQARVQTLGTSGRVFATAVAPVVATVFTPAQIRAAYSLPPVPAAGAGVTAATAALLGQGQTIYIVDAYHSVTALADLNTFSSKFGLPLCVATTTLPNTALPLAAPAGFGCSLSVVSSTPAGGMTSVVPAYNAGWAPESALDVQWAHAMAPYARIVLIEAASPSGDQLTGAVKLANSMGPGAVSMSFSAPEGTWTAYTDAVFTGKGMTYLAATGDAGAQVNWPAVSANVLAVGGTSLKFNSAGPRSESAWSRTGGGLSAYTALPLYQAKVAMAGQGAVKTRGVADVSFNADPMTGQYVALTTAGATAASWYSYGGTSISTPQWAGLITVANATRVAAGKPVLGAAHPALYIDATATPSSYTAAFSDISTGANGTCTACTTGVGYDVPTGLGTPNFTGLLPILQAYVSAPSIAVPVVPGGVFAVKAGVSFLGFLNVTQATPGPITYVLTGAPAGMALTTSGLLAWPSPKVGNYTFSVKATNAAGGSAQAIYGAKVL